MTLNFQSRRREESVPNAQHLVLTLEQTHKLFFENSRVFHHKFYPRNMAILSVLPMKTSLFSKNKCGIRMKHMHQPYFQYPLFTPKQTFTIQQGILYIEVSLHCSINKDNNSYTYLLPLLYTNSINLVWFFKVATLSHLGTKVYFVIRDL